MNTSSRAIPEKLKELLEEFRSIEDRDLKSELLIEYAERFSEVPEAIARRPFDEKNRVPACESEAFVFVEQKKIDNSESERPYFYFAVENPQGISAMALAVILGETLSGCCREEIAKIQEDLVFDIFGRELSMGKGLGLKSMISLVKEISARSEH